MATSATDAWDRGYQQALDTLLDEAKADGPGDRALLRKERAALEHAGAYQTVRAALDAAPASLYMSRPTAQFYLVMSPSTFKQALARGPHPFGEHQAGATKGEIDAWFKAQVEAKHVKEIPKVVPLRVSRDLDSGRPYLVDITGTILADGAISNIHAQDVAHAASRGAGIRILTLTAALAQPWRDPVERGVWAAWRQWLLQRAIDQAEEQLRQAQAQDLAASFPDKPSSGRKPPL